MTERDGLEFADVISDVIHRRDASMDSHHLPLCILHELLAQHSRNSRGVHPENAQLDTGEQSELFSPKRTSSQCSPSRGYLAVVCAPAGLLLPGPERRKPVNFGC